MPKSQILSIVFCGFDKNGHRDLSEFIGRKFNYAACYFQGNGGASQYLSSTFCTALCWLTRFLVMSVEENQVVETLLSFPLSIKK